MPEEKDTAKAGAEPADKAAEAKTADKAGAEPAAKDAKSDSSTENVPFDKDPRWKSARLAEKKLQDLLKANELEDADDLQDLIRHGKAVKGKIKDLNDLDNIIKDAEEIRSYKPIWKKQEEERKRGQETEAETIARLERELHKRDSEVQRREMERKQADEAKRAINFFDGEVSNLIGELEVPKEQKAFTLKFFGVGNPVNDIDITDKKAIKRLIEEGNKDLENFKQSVIKEYLDGKTATPKAGSTSTGPSEENKPRLNLKTARAAMKEMFQRTPGG